MATQNVQFEFVTGLKRRIFRNARLRGSWDSAGRYSDLWKDSPMEEVPGSDGCPVFRATVALDAVPPARRSGGASCWTAPRARTSGAFPRRSTTSTRPSVTAVSTEGRAARWSDTT